MLLAALVATMWGFNFVVIDWGMRGIPPLFFVAVRFAVVALAVVVVPRPLASWKTIVGVGLFMSLGQFALLYTSIALGLQPGIAALLLQAQVVLTIVVAALALRLWPARRIERGARDVDLPGDRTGGAVGPPGEVLK